MYISYIIIGLVDFLILRFVFTGLTDPVQLTVIASKKFVSAIIFQSSFEELIKIPD